jgi:hypothetical protein
MHIHDERRLAARTPIYDHAGMELGRYEPARIRELMRRSDIHVSGTKNRIKALHFLGPDPSGLQSGSRHRRPAGTPHKNETYFNPPGVWHLDRIPTGWRMYFTPRDLYA